MTLIQTHTQKIPELRFPGFVGEWEMKRLGDLSDFQSGYAFSSNQMNLKRDNFQLIKMSNVYKGILDLDRSPSYWNRIEGVQKKVLLKEGDTVLTLTGTVGKRDYGYSVQINQNNKFLLNQRLVRIRGIEKVSSSNFLFRLVSGERFLYYFFSESKGGTGNQSNVSTEDIKNIKLSLPQLQEQNKIADFLSTVDSRIENLKTKKKELEEYKKGVMQKIFSQELRLKDENGESFEDWVEKRLGEVCKITTGKLDANAMVEGGEFRFYTCAREFFQIDNYAFDTEALLISGNGANVGYIHYYKGKFNAYQRTYVLDGFKEYIFFVKFYLDKFLKKRIGAEKNEGNTPYIVMGTLADMKISFPSLPEQQKIADFLSGLDEKIEKENEKIERVEEWKRGLLQKMFI